MHQLVAFFFRAQIDTAAKMLNCGSAENETMQWCIHVTQKSWCTERSGINIMVYGKKQRADVQKDEAKIQWHYAQKAGVRKDKAKIQWCHTQRASVRKDKVKIQWCHEQKNWCAKR